MIDNWMIGQIKIIIGLYRRNKYKKYQNFWKTKLDKEKMKNGSFIDKYYFEKLLKEVEKQESENNE